MKTVGIICEYNPFHMGHAKQIRMIRDQYGSDCSIVCLMSGNYVQRGIPAIFDKSLRAEAAIRCGADLVLELPVTYALSSAEGFAAGGVRILSGFCDELCFGTETGTKETLLSTAEALLSSEFIPALRARLETGISFPAARQMALSDLGADASLLSNPNDILAVEYCKAILCQSSNMRPFPIVRQGNYHDTEPDPENPSATAVREMIVGKHDWKSCIPESAQSIFDGAAIHTLPAGERAILARLRTMTDTEFEALPFGSEGLWRRLMHACREYATLDEILAAAKTKRYTRTRLDRMVMCAFLGITRELLESSAPYTRVLGFNDAGRSLLKAARASGYFPHIGETTDNAYEQLEQRCDDLYSLFRMDAPGAPNMKRKVFILP